MLSNPWQLLPTKPPYVLSTDASAIHQYNANSSQKYWLHLNALPEPFFGSPSAPVVLLGLNPGFDDRDPEIHINLKFQKMVRDNYQHSASDYPFYYLDPRFKSPGREWWEMKLKPLLRIFTREELSQSLLCVEYFPYHSRRFHHAKLKLPSQEYGFNLVRSAHKRGATILIMRANSLWLESVPALKTYPTLRLLNPRNVVISSGNCPEFDGIVSTIRHRCSAAAQS